MVHAREVRPLRLRPGITGMQLLDVVKRRAGFGDGQVESASGAPLLHTDDAVPEGHYFFTPWPRGVHLCFNLFALLHSVMPCVLGEQVNNCLQLLTARMMAAFSD